MTSHVGDREFVLAPGLRNGRANGGQAVVYTPRGRDESHDIQEGVASTNSTLDALSAFRQPRPAPKPDDPNRPFFDDMRRLGIICEVPRSVSDLPRPSLEIELTNRCNADCVMCPREDLRPLGSMTGQTIEALGELLPHIAEGVVFSGIGEPTLHPQLTQVVEMVRRRSPEGAKIVVVTNGSLMTPLRMESLLVAGVDLMQWSLHSADLDEENEIMGWSRSAQALRNLNECAAKYSANISINCVGLEDGNAKSVRKLATERLGIPAGRVKVIEPFTRGSFVTLRTSKNRVDRHDCYYMRSTLFIAWNGDMLPCSNDIEGSSAVGSINNLDGEDILQLWRSKVLVSDPNFPMCEGCNHHRRVEVPSTWLSTARTAVRIGP